jgi:hypothetical protein
MPYLSITKRGYASQFDLVEIVNAILYKLKSRCQWQLLPIGHLFNNLDVGFDDQKLRSALIPYGIISNLCPNPRNGGEITEEWLYDEEMYKER